MSEKMDNAHVEGVIISLLDEKLRSDMASCGKRFSTYCEGMGQLQLDLARAMDAVSALAKVSDYTWGGLRLDRVPESPALLEMENAAVAACARLVSVAADAKKLMGGVVHEPVKEPATAVLNEKSGA